MTEKNLKKWCRHLRNPRTEWFTSGRCTWTSLLLRSLCRRGYTAPCSPLPPQASAGKRLKEKEHHIFISKQHMWYDFIKPTYPECWKGLVSSRPCPSWPPRRERPPHAGAPPLFSLWEPSQFADRKGTTNLCPHDTALCVSLEVMLNSHF